jgi:hypothetical protein
MTTTTTSWANKHGAQRAFQNFLGAQDVDFDSVITTDGNRWFVKVVFGVDIAEARPSVVEAARERFGNVEVLNGKLPAPVPSDGGPKVERKPVQLETLDQTPTPPVDIKSDEQPKAKVSKPTKGTSKSMPVFRPGSKRAKSLELLTRPEGATVAQGKKAFAWNENVVKGQFYETSKMTGRKLVVEPNDKGEAVYRLR